MDDHEVSPRSSREIELLTLAWRDALGVSERWVPDVIRILEIDLPKYCRQFALVVRPDGEMGDAEAYTEINPPHIAVRASVYQLARAQNGRARMTFAHEFGHLVMHPSEVANLRSEGVLQRAYEIPRFKSAEWQARKFASLFLMPTDIVRQFGTARDLSESCKVSLQAAEIRFQEVGHIPPKPLPDCVLDALKKLKS